MVQQINQNKHSYFSMGISGINTYMAGKLFDRLEKEAFRGGIQARTKESMTWFRQRVSTIKGVSRQELLKDAVSRKRQIFGEMMMFMYDPKHKKTLPYYDRFPLCIPVEPAKGGFYGLNLHYLPHTLRAQFLDALYERTNNDKFDATTRFKLTYKLLKGISGKPYYKACYKHYLSSHVKSKFARVDSADWEIAIFLPIESFRKSSMGSVWKESRKRITG